VSEPDYGVLHHRLLAWYGTYARDLPWRAPRAGAYAVLVSEVMLQQTPVARVLPVYESWMQRWPTVFALAAASGGDAVRAWGRLGYPRRALRLHAAARVVVDTHAGVVPSDLDDLRALPGVGEYTAAAVASFAHRQRHAVLDTNVRRVLSRLLAGEALPPAGIRQHERKEAIRALPDDGDTAAAWAVAVMELGALVCTASAPRCAECPVADLCRWRRAGSPAYAGLPRPRQAWSGTDRQCRGELLAVLRDADEPVEGATLGAQWPDQAQRDRALHGLLADGLVASCGEDRFELPR
jgi:A/G-specific adenine glycosylase